MKRLLAEPVLHFLLLGAGLFGLHSALGRAPDQDAAAAEVVVSRGRIAALAETFARQWGRPPSGDELSALVQDFVREEVLMREALLLGLDRDDTIVRRRLAQKMEFLSEDLVSTLVPGEDDLRAFLAAHPERFRTETRLTFSQVHLDPLKRGARLEADAAALLGTLRAGLVAMMPGDSRMLEAEQRDLTSREVEATFGSAFAARLAELPLDTWEGPIASSYGVHLVRVERRLVGAVPALDDVREAVAREWTAARRVELKTVQLQELLARYRVTIEAPPQVADAAR